MLSDSAGTAVSRLGYDRWGQRRDADGWGSATGAAPTAKGYTGHTMEDSVGVIHLGGRVYDPLIGRFTSPDPILQAPGNLQSYNRYGYVANNPLSLTDPSGYSWLSNALHRADDWLQVNWRTVAAVAVTAVSGGAALGASSAWLGATYAAAGGFAAGMVASGGDVQAGLVGALTAVAFYGVGSYFQSMQSVRPDGSLASLSQSQQFAKVLAHGAVGGASSVASGGKFGPGALSALVPEAGRAYAGLGNNTLSAALLGGTASVVGGGKFANGAVTGAFAYAFGEMARRRAATTTGDASPLDANSDDSQKGSGWFRPKDHIYVVGRPGNDYVSPGVGVGRFIDDFLPAGHTFGTNHDAGVGYMVNNLGLPDLLVNIPSMPPIYVFSVGQELINTPVHIMNLFSGTRHQTPFQHSHEVEGQR